MKDLLKEENIYDFNTKLLDNSGIENFVYVILNNKPIITINYLESNVIEEKPPVFSQLYFQHKQKVVQTSTYKVNSSFSHGIPYNEKQKEELIKDIIISELSSSLSKLVTNKIKELSNITYLNSYNWFEKLLNKLYELFGRKYIKKTRIKTSIDLITYITIKLNKIYSKVRNLSNPYIICSPRVGAFLRDGYEFFHKSNEVESIKTGASSFLLGTMYNIKVFVDPMMDDNNVYISFNNSKEETHVSPKLCLYLQENGTQFEEIKQYHGHYLESEPDNKIELSLKMALFTIGENVSDLFDKIVLKLPKKI